MTHESAILTTQISSPPSFEFDLVFDLGAMNLKIELRSLSVNDLKSDELDEQSQSK